MGRPTSFNLENPAIFLIEISKIPVNSSECPSKYFIEVPINVLPHIKPITYYPVQADF